MLVKTFGGAVNGIDARIITVETDIVSGVNFYLVGLPDSAVKESQQRIESALRSVGYQLPGRKITINMAPADIRKEGTAYDMTLAIGILLSMFSAQELRLAIISQDSKTIAKAPGIGAKTAQRMLIDLKDKVSVEETFEKIEKIEKINLVEYGEGMVEQLVSTFDIVRKISLGTVVALIVVTAFLIVNTIKITIFSRKREIEIMRLVGASNFTIKTPFIVEGMILGVFGSIIPIIISTYGYLAFYNHFDGYLFSELIQLIKPEPFIYMTSLIVLVIGIIVGMIGSASAVKKYLKV